MPGLGGARVAPGGYKRSRMSGQSYKPARTKYRGPTTRTARSASSYPNRKGRMGRLGRGGQLGRGPGGNYGYYGPGGGGYKGGGGGARKAPSLASWLGKDADYQDQLRAYARSLSDFNADVKRRKGKIEADYTAGTKSMGEQRVKDLQDIMNDFAARGLLKSGLYGQRQADYEKQYNTNLSELGRNRTGLLGDISQESKNFQREQSLGKESARKEAARRRAEKYGI